MIERIKTAETAFDRASSAVDNLETALDDYLEAEEDLSMLTAYLSSEERRFAVTADEAGQLPADLKRGVLSEDGIWNLLEKHGELISVMEKLVRRRRGMTLQA